jgi:hypothetical protein
MRDHQLAIFKIMTNSSIVIIKVHCIKLIIPLQLAKEMIGYLCQKFHLYMIIRMIMIRVVVVQVQVVAFLKCLRSRESRLSSLMISIIKYSVKKNKR